MKWLLIGLAVLAGLVGVVLLIGTLLPQSHVASVTREYDADPALVWRTITDVEGFPGWRPGLDSVQRLAPLNGRERWREHTGQDQMTFEITETVPQQRLVTRIADEGLPFGGTWTYELAPSGARTRLTITERGEIYNPLFRFIARFVMGYSGTMEQYHAGLQQKLTRTQ